MDTCANIETEIFSAVRDNNIDELKSLFSHVRSNKKFKKLKYKLLNSECLTVLAVQSLTADRSILSSSVGAKGPVHMLKFLKEQGCRIGNECLTLSIKVQTIECFKYIHEAGVDITKVIIHKITTVEILKYAHENGCPWNGLEIATYIIDNNFECFMYCITNGAPWCPRDTAGNAIAHGRLEFLKVLIQHNHELTTRMCYRAAKYGHLDILKYLVSIGCPWDSETTAGAVEYGSLEILEYAYSHGCPINEYTFKFATGYNRIEMVNWLLERNCRFNSQAIVHAANNNHLNMVKLMISKGCPVTAEAIDMACRKDSIDCVKFLVENNYPIAWHATVRSCFYFQSISCLKYMFSRWTGTPQEFFNMIDLDQYTHNRLPSSKTWFVHECIDLDDPLWRVLLKLDLSKSKTLHTKIEAKNQEISENIQKCHTGLSMMPKDIVSYIIPAYF
jgi:hypothetical protein